MRRLIFAICAIAILGALQPPPEASAQDTRKRERPDPPERPERDYVPKTFTHRNPPPTKRSSPASSSPKSKQAQPTSAWTPAPPRDPDLARCDDFRRRLEQVIRQEGHAGSSAAVERLAQERQTIYRAQLRGGCI